MIKVNVLNKVGQLGWSASFSTQEEADTWIATCVANSSWGKPERWVKENEEDISGATSTREIELVPAIPEILDENGNVLNPAIPAATETEYFLLAEYTVQQLDVTAELAQQALVEDGVARQNLGAAVIAKVYSINESKNISAEAFAAMIADANLERIERMLWTGSLRTAKLMIQALDTAYFTAEEKQSILDMLTNY